jgi:outer membrane lipoprotein-sorting protein
VMKKHVVFIILILFFWGALLFSETLEEILAKNYQTRGGLEKLKAIKTVKVEGKMVMTMQNMEIPITMWIKKPDKMRMDASYMGKKVVVAYDGKKAWMINPMMGSEDPQELPEERTKEMSQQVDSLFPLLDYKEKGHQLEYLGKEDMEGTEVYKLKMTKTDDKVFHFYLDTETGIELKISTYTKVQDKDTLVETLMVDYKEVDGIMIPFSFESKVAGMEQGQKIVFTSFKQNVTLEDSFFQMPPKKAPQKEEK